MAINMKNKLPLGVLLLAICASSFVLEAKAQQVNVEEFCAQTYIPGNKAFCLRILAGTTSWAQASMSVVNRLTRLMHRGVDPTLKTIEAKLLPSIAPPKKAEILNKCRSSYADVVEGLGESKNLIVKDWSHAYLTQLSYVSISFNDCREAIIDQKGQPEIVELNKFNAHIKKLLDVALSLGAVDPRVPKTQPFM